MGYAKQLQVHRSTRMLVNLTGAGAIWLPIARGRVSRHRVPGIRWVRSMLAASGSSASRDSPTPLRVLCMHPRANEVHGAAV